MGGFSCKDVLDRLDDLEGKAGIEAAQGELLDHIEGCARCREAYALWSGFCRVANTAEPAGLPPLVERRLLIHTAAGRADHHKRPWRLATAVVMATAALLLAAWWLGPPATVAPSASQERFALSAPSTGALHKTREHTIASLGPQRPFSLADGRRVFVTNVGTNLWLDQDAEVDAELISDARVVYRLQRGRVLAEVHAPFKGYRFVVKTPSGEVEAKGTVFSVEVADDGTETARVLRGVIEVRQLNQAEGQGRLLYAGEETTVATLTPARRASADAVTRDTCLQSGCSATDQLATIKAPPASPPAALEDERPQPRSGATGSPSRAAQGPRRTPDVLGPSQNTAQATASASSAELTVKANATGATALIAMAMSYRQAGAYTEAAEVYQQLIDEHVTSSAGLNAFVSLGQLELKELHAPAKALEHFGRYLTLAPTGFLSEEARLGLVRADAALGRRSALIAAASDYLEQHPAGYAGAEVLRRRGDAYRQGGDCARAITDYRQLSALWPTSKENEPAEEGLAACHAVP